MKIAMKWIILLIVVGGPMKSVFGENLLEKRVAHFAFELPPGYALKNITPKMADFELVEISKINSSNIAMDIYFGNHPSFPGYEWTVIPSDERGKNYDRKSFDYRDSDGAFEGVLTFTGLTYKDSTFSPYTKIHYFAKGVDKNSADQFVGIISHLRVVESHLK